MSKDAENKQEELSKNTKPEKYERPSIVSEDLNTYGASCNGTTKGGRKATTAPPTPCNPSKLNS